jgi:hypothetical protein
VTLRFRHLLVALLAASLLALAGCGGSDEPEGAKLPSSAVAELNQRLTEIQRRYDDAKQNDNPGACDDIQQDSFPAVSRTIDGLPEDVDGKLRDAVTESFANLQRLTDEGCQDVAPKTDTETTPTETIPPETVPPETTPTETTPPETTPTETTPPETQQNGNGNGNGKAKGNNGGATPQTGNGNGNGGGTQAPSSGGTGN